VVVDPAALRAFQPNFALVHTTWRDVRSWPALADDEAAIERRVGDELARFKAIWQRLSGELDCIVIQNNFDCPPVRVLGNLEASVGRNQFVGLLNVEFARAARVNKRLRINDAAYLSARLGHARWASPEAWYAWKLAVSAEGTTSLAHSAARIVCSALGKVRKCLVLDLDNTLWGGVIGDDGVANLKLGTETAEAEAYTEFQRYCLALKQRGVLLAVCSKNELATAKDGFSHPDSVLKLEDFSAFRASWEPKSQEVAAIAQQLNIGLDSLVFVDDNPAERALVAAQLPQVAVPEVGSDPSRFAEVLDGNAWFEPAAISSEDLARTRYYQDNEKRAEAEASFANYGEFLKSLEMTAEIDGFVPVYLERIAQLTNKTNQFNLTTKRYTLADIQAMAGDTRWVTLYGRLVDRFGDNGLVSVVAGQIAGSELVIDLWLMSCRVLRRDLELAMLDALVEGARAGGASALVGTYLRTPKNNMVCEHYGNLGFALVDGDPRGERAVWKLDLAGYRTRNRHIRVTRHA
jgi:FkbH-like protein